ncbi:MAG: hypothetical protein AAF497_17895 [Planctomycetota bacterium]
MLRRVLLCLAVFSAAAHGQLILNEDVGVLALGSTMNLTGTTVGAGDEAAYYEGFTNTAGNWGEDYVYQFTTEVAGTYQIMSNAVTGDPDFFLLNSLDVGFDGVKDFAAGTLQADFLDAGPPEFGGPISIPAGTYYLSVDSWHGVDGNTSPQYSTWDVNIILS